MPGAQEPIKYRIPALVLNESLVHFAAFKDQLVLSDAVGDREIQRGAVAMRRGERISAVSYR